MYIVLLVFLILVLFFCVFMAIRESSNNVKIIVILLFLSPLYFLPTFMTDTYLKGHRVGMGIHAIYGIYAGEEEAALMWSIISIVVFCIILSCSIILMKIKERLNEARRKGAFMVAKGFIIYTVINFFWIASNLYRYFDYH